MQWENHWCLIEVRSESTIYITFFPVFRCLLIWIPKIEYGTTSESLLMAFVIRFWFWWPRLPLASAIYHLLQLAHLQCGDTALSGSACLEQASQPLEARPSPYPKAIIICISNGAALSSSGHHTSTAPAAHPTSSQRPHRRVSPTSVNACKPGYMPLWVGVVGVGWLVAEWEPIVMPLRWP